MFQQLFDLGIQYGYQSKSRNLNGQESWGYLKSKLDTAKICQWSMLRLFPDGESTNDISRIYNKVHDELKMHGEDGDEPKYGITHPEWERYHYVLQTIRLPKNEVDGVSIQKIIQIAFNIGQYQAEIDKYNKVINDYVTNNNLDKVKSYVNLEECKPSNDLLEHSIQILHEGLEHLEHLSKNMKGGLPIGISDPYYAKYLKYKSKYLALRKQF
jgi:hypothetical protein